MSVPRVGSQFSKAVLALLIIFILVFPKGGLKIGSVPITWGYLLLGLAVIAHLPKRLALGKAFCISRARWSVLIALIPFQVLALLTLVLMGFDDTGFAISLVVSFIALPWMLILIFSDLVESIDLAFFIKLFRASVLAIAVYGIFLFGYRIATGRFIEVPYLTVNAADVGHLEDKNNDRGFALKLISTYNNGNVYGASVLMLLPLYAEVEQKRWRRGMVKLSLLLTLSRTTWIGLIVYELVWLFYLKAPPLRRLMAGNVSRKWLNTLIKGAVLVTSIVAMIVAGLLYNGIDIGFIFDKNLGGRVSQISFITKATLFPSVRFDAVTEIVYLSVLNQFGIIGLVAFLLAMTAPLLLLLNGQVPYADTPFKKSIAAGLLVYLVIAGSDGALLYIPVMLFYWALVSLLLSKQSFATQTLAMKQAA